MRGTSAAFAARSRDIGNAVLNGYPVPAANSLQLESACTLTAASLLKASVSSCPHLADVASVLVAVHDRFARPVASAMADTGTEVKQIGRAHV